MPDRAWPRISIRAPSQIQGLKKYEVAIELPRSFADDNPHRGSCCFSITPRGSRFPPAIDATSEEKPHEALAFVGTRK
jgi:hypothetical protein